MQTLQFFLNSLTKGRKIHISIFDATGILNTPITKISRQNINHSKFFCDIAKSTDKGYSFCLRCKKLANTKAITQKKPFSGHCIFGLYEVAFPVIINEKVAAIVYVGNAIINEDEIKKRIDRVCHYTGVNSESLYNQTKECEFIDNADELFGIAEIVSDYIKMLCEKTPKEKENNHWLVLEMKNYAKEEYTQNPTLKDLAIIYQKNEKYMGRLFEKHMGVSFSRYCLTLRLKSAQKLLTTTNTKILDIALDCGFNNISYFNRAFKKHYGSSPSQYRLNSAQLTNDKL